MSGSNPLAAVLASEGQSNPMAMAGGVINLAKGAQDVRTSQFNLQQAQLQPGYQAMRMLMATNPNPSDDDVMAALGGATRLGGNVDGIVQNFTNWRARGGTPADFMRATALGGMSPENQAQFGVGTPVSVDTGGNIVFGMRGGPLSSTPGQFTGATSIQKGFTPAESAEFIAVPDVDAQGNPTGTTHMVPRGTEFGTGVPGSGPPGAGGGGGGAGFGGGPLLPPGAPVADQEARLQQIALRESGGQNILNRQGPGGSPLSSASGIYQMIDSTWLHAAQLAGINTQQYPRAINAPPQLQHAAALALMNEQGERPWATSAPQGRGGGGGGGGPPAAGPFVGATSAQPTSSGGPPVQPVSGVQYLDPTGRPIPQGGGGGYGGGGPILTPPSPYVLPQWEQSSKDYVAGQVIDKTLGQRIAPLQSAIGLVKDNPGLVTGPSAENWYQWVQGLAGMFGMKADVHNADAYQQLVKELGKNLLNNGADPTDMARLMREASQPNPTQQGREALVTLAAEQIGYERMKSMQYREFRSRHPNDANNKSQFFNAETGDFASDLDPKAVAADLIPQAELVSYFRGLNPDAQKRFGQTLKDASRLFKFQIPQVGG